MSGPGGESSPRPSPEEIAAAIRALRVGDLLQSTIFTLAQLGFAKLDETARDLEQARLAIEALRALLPVAEEALGADLARDLRQTVTNLQLAYAAAAAPTEPEEPTAPAEEEQEAPPSDAEAAAGRSEPSAAEPAPGGEPEPDGEAGAPR